MLNRERHEAYLGIVWDGRVLADMPESCHETRKGTEEEEIGIE